APADGGLRQAHASRAQRRDGRPRRPAAPRVASASSSGTAWKLAGNPPSGQPLTMDIPVPTIALVHGCPYTKWCADEDRGGRKLWSRAHHAGAEGACGG